MDNKQLSQAIRLIMDDRHTVKEVADILGISVEELVEGMGGLNYPEPTTKFGKLRQMVQKHSSVIVIVGTGVLTLLSCGNAIAAGVYAQRVRDLEAKLVDQSSKNDLYIQTVDDIVASISND